MNQQSFSLPSESIVNKAFQKNGRNDVIKWAVRAIPKACRFKIIFESWDKAERHGIWLRVDGKLVVNGVESQSMEIWADTAPHEIVVDVLSGPQCPYRALQ